jgi:hypothetical protein
MPSFATIARSFFLTLRLQFTLLHLPSRVILSHSLLLEATYSELGTVPVSLYYSSFAASYLLLEANPPPPFLKGPKHDQVECGFFYTNQTHMVR